MNASPEPATSPSPFSHPVRVYWEDTDAGGVVFYANYLKYFERARTEWLRALGFSQAQMLDHDAVMFVVTDTTLRYRRAARLDDLLQVTVAVRGTGRASMHIAQQAWRGDALLAEGDIRIGCVAARPTSDGTFRACRIPLSIVEKLA